MKVNTVVKSSFSSSKTILRRGARVHATGLRRGILGLLLILVTLGTAEAAPSKMPEPLPPTPSPRPTPVIFKTSDFAKPFWEGKPKLEAKLRDDRAVLVSVRTDRGEIDKEADLFSINGVGWVKRSDRTIFELAKRFDRLKEISSHFREVNFDPKTNRVFVICEALGYQARMLIAVDPQEGTAAGVDPRIRFKVIDGHFVGLEGMLVFHPLGAKVSGGDMTEVSLRVRHEAREIPIPRILVGFALEVLVQKVAQSMRTYFENTPLTP